MLQVIEQTDQEKISMYMKQPKKKLAEMLCECNKHFDRAPIVVSEWQLCPKCGGTGKMFIIPSGTTAPTGICDCCNGAKMLIKPIIK